LTGAPTSYGIRFKKKKKKKKIVEIDAPWGLFGGKEWNKEYILFCLLQ